MKMVRMGKLEKLTEHTTFDKTTQMTTRSGVLEGISLGNYSKAIDSRNPLEVGHGFRNELESYFDLPVKYLFLTHTHSDHRGGMEVFKESILIISQKCKENLPKSTSLSNKDDIRILVRSVSTYYSNHQFSKD